MYTFSLLGKWKGLPVFLQKIGYEYVLVNLQYMTKAISVTWKSPLICTELFYTTIRASLKYNSKSKIKSKLHRSNLTFFVALDVTVACDMKIGLDK